MRRIPQPSSVLLFGSVARNQSDQLSDRDVLIVDDDERVRHAAREHLRRAGWSPICYSWARLNRSIDSHRLFIQHLRLEGRLYTDVGNRLRDTLESFTPQPSYSSDIDTARNFLTLLREIPKSDRGLHWALDVLHVGLRNLGVLELANRGMYRFGLQEILTDLTQIGVLQKGDVPALVGLRRFKRAYRSGRIQSDVTFSKVRSLIATIDQRFDLGLTPKLVDAERVVELALERPTGSCWYQMLRRLEASCLVLRANHSGGDDSIAAFAAEINRSVRSPSDYGWNIKINADRLQRTLGRITARSDVAYFFNPQQQAVCLTDTSDRVMLHGRTRFRRGFLCAESRHHYSDPPANPQAR